MGGTEDSAAGSAADSPLLTSMTGKASPAKSAVGDRPVFDYIASLPEPQRSIALAIDDLAARTLPGLERSVKWGMAYYGVGDGWCFSSGAFVGHVKLMFINGATLLDPVPPVTPTGMGKATRGVELETLQDLDEPQAGLWMNRPPQHRESAESGTSDIPPDPIARPHVKAGLTTSQRTSPRIRQSRERRVVAHRAAAKYRPGVAPWRERRCGAAADAEVANVLADRLTVAASNRSGAPALIDRAGARSSPRISSQLDDLQQ